jgi:hypothetical protein
MKKRLSGIILATEIVAIVALHTLKINHPEKTAKLPKSNAVSQQINISLSHAYSFSNLR